MIAMLLLFAADGIYRVEGSQTITLCHDGMDDENTLDEPEKITQNRTPCRP